MVRRLLALVVPALLVVPRAAGGGPVITEFMASNTGAFLEEAALRDADGDTSDWIEITNEGFGNADVEGWYLTDDPDDLMQWALPAVSLGPYEAIIVFASGKNRVGPELHTNFRLDADGEYLALVLPDGRTIASAFGPGGTFYPEQRTDVSYGIGGIVQSTVLIGTGDTARIHVPASGDAGTAWTGGNEPFDDAAWLSGATGVGYETDDPGPGPAVLSVTQDLVLWLDATKGVTTDGDTRVTAWDDQLIGDNTAANDASGRAGHRPLYVPDGSPNGDAAVIRFDGTEASADGATWLDVPHAAALNPGTGGWTVFVAGVQENATGFWVSKGNRGSANDGYSIWAEQGTLHVRAGTGEGTDPLRRGAQNRPLPSIMTVVTLLLTGTEIYGFTNGSNDGWLDGGGGGQGRSVEGDISNIDPFVIGARNNHDFNMRGDIGEILVFATELSEEDRTSVEEYLVKKWLEGGAGADPHYHELIATDVTDAMRGRNASAYVRMAFMVEEDPASFDRLTLGMRYDDGFIAYLNGREIARRNAPAVSSWNAAATAAHPDESAIVAEAFGVTQAAGDLRPGQNILAIHGLNIAADDNDFLLVPELSASRVAEGVSYFPEPTPGAPNGDGVRGFVEPPRFSVERGFYDEPFEVSIATDTPDATIVVTTDGTKPTLTNGVPYAGPIAITATATPRAAAFREGYLPSIVVTHTYIFLDDVLGQTGAGMPGSFDYAMDPEVVTDPVYGPAMRDSLLSLPVVSLVMDAEADLFGPAGIYANPFEHGPEYERETSLELFFPDGSGEGFQVNAGLRIHGGAARERPKKSFRLYFRRQYGVGRLRYPLYADSPVRSFDQLVLRGGYNDTWNIGNTSLESQYLRDQFARQSQLEMDHLASRYYYAHLYINGLYWGLYDLSERINASFAGDHLGGGEEEWDVVKHTQSGSATAELLDGERAAWDQAVARANAGLASLQEYETFGELVDVVNLADYMLLNFYAGSTDWPQRNWFAVRRRQEGERFRFVAWDTERAFRIPQLTINRTGVSGGETPAQLYARVRSNPEFQLLFGDRVNRYFFNGGLLTPERTVPRYQEISERMEGAVVAESARWGDSSYPGLVTFDDWTTERSKLLASYFPQRATIVLGQLRAIGLYPDLAAPTFNQHGGSIDPGFVLTMAAPQGTIYYTTDGTDPRLAGGAVAPGALIAESPGSVTVIATGAPTRILVPEDGALGLAWIEPDFDDAAWFEGPTGIGYERSSGFEDLIATDLEAAMFTVASSVYARAAFALEDVDPASAVTLRMKYDDGFVAYLNGHQIASVNAPADPGWDAGATRSHADGEAVVFEDFPVDGSFLRPGLNVLAVHGLNAGADSSDFLILPELLMTGAGGNGVVLEHTTHVHARAWDNGQWSALTEAFFHVFTPLDALRITEVMYHPLDDERREIDGDQFEFIELKNVGAQVLDLTDVRFTEGIFFAFPEGAILLPGQFAVLVHDEAFRTRYPDVDAVAGVYGGNLSNAGEILELRDALGEVLAVIPYGDTWPWPPEADGLGHSLVPVDPDRLSGEDAPGYWRPSSSVGGSPGRDDPADPHTGELFKRGDANGDGTLNIADAVYTLQHLFAQGPGIACPDAGDANDDEEVNIADAVYTLQHLFAQGPPVPPPGLDACGEDPTPHPAGGIDLPACSYDPASCATAR